MMLHRLRTLSFCLVIFCMNASNTPSVSGDETAKMPATKAADIDDQLGYFLGFSVGQSFMQQGFQQGDFTLKGVSQGLSDSIAGSRPALSDEVLRELQGKIQALLQKRQAEFQAKQQEAMRVAGIANKEKSELFLQQNAKAEGVQSFDNGIQYKILKKGTGGSPAIQDTIVVHYTGKNVEGEVFDSSVQRGEPMTASLSGMIPGWKLAVPKMKVGGKWQIFIPSELAYGADGSPPVIEPNEALIFEIELLEIK